MTENNGNGESFEEKARKSIKKNRKDLSQVEEEISPQINAIESEEYGKTIALNGVIRTKFLNKKYLNKVFQEIGWKVVDIEEKQGSESSGDSGDGEVIF